MNKAFSFSVKILFEFCPDLDYGGAVWFRISHCLLRFGITCQQSSLQIIGTNVSIILTSRHANM